MKQIILTSLIAFVALSLAGCGEELKSQEYYKKHKDEAKEKIKECNKHEKELMQEQSKVLHGQKPSIEFQNCFNAQHVISMGDDSNPYDHPTNKESYKW